MRWTLALVVVLGGCDLLGPDFRFVNRRPMDPVPEVYAEWYAKTEACLGVSGDFGAAEWHAADSVNVDDVPRAGALRFPHEVTMWRGAAALEWAVRHEMVHHVTQTGDALHNFWGRVPCES